MLGDAHYAEIRWPADYVVPFAFLSPPKEKQLGTNPWLQMLAQQGQDQGVADEEAWMWRTHLPAVRLLCLGRKVSRSTPSFSWDPELGDLNEVVDDDADEAARGYGALAQTQDAAAAVVHLRGQGKWNAQTYTFEKVMP